MKLVLMRKGTNKLGTLLLVLARYLTFDGKLHLKAGGRLHAPWEIKRSCMPKPKVQKQGSCRSRLVFSMCLLMVHPLLVLNVQCVYAALSWFWRRSYMVGVFPRTTGKRLCCLLRKNKVGYGQLHCRHWHYLESRSKK